MNYLIENWYFVVGLAVVITVVTIGAINIVQLPSNKQLEKVKEWWIFACLEAERNFKSGTGALKLRFVYDSFIARFTWLAKIVSFEMFSMMVDEALVTVREMLEKNKAISDLGEKE